MQLEERITLYLDKIPGAISGSDGHGQTFAVACALINGFALDGDTALRHLTAYNAKCLPPWSPRELRHKISQAEKTTHTKPRGYLLGPGGTGNAGNTAQNMLGQRGPKLVPVVRRPEKHGKGDLRTLRTLFPDIRVTRTQARADVTGSIGEIPSEASALAIAGIHATASTSVGIPIDPPLDWTAINAEFPPTPEDEAWRAVEAAGFGDEPLVALAFSLFGPGCQVIPAGEAASV